MSILLDSGTSTLPGEDNPYENQYSPELDEETTNAIRMLDSVVMNGEHELRDVQSPRGVPSPRSRTNVPTVITPRRGQVVNVERDRDLTEVSDGEAVEENFELYGVWIYSLYYLMPCWWLLWF